MGPEVWAISPDLNHFFDDPPDSFGTWAPRPDEYTMLIFNEIPADLCSIFAAPLTMRILAPILTALLPFLAVGQTQTHVFGKTVDGPPDRTSGTAVITLEQPEVAETVSNPGFGDRFRYGIPQTLDVDFMDAADWSTTDDGQLVGRLEIRSPGATSMNVFFSTFHLSGNAKILVSSTTLEPVSNTYEAEANLWSAGRLQTALVPGDAVVIEFQGNPDDQASSLLEIQSVVHGTADLFGNDPARDSYDCLIDVACSEGADWQDQTRSVVMFTREDGDGCTGVLLNNTSGDGTPYLYIAHHCRGGNNPNNWVFYFNFQKTACGSGSAPQTQTVHGAQVVADSYEGDFDLLQLQQTPPASFQPYYAGWDRSNNTPVDGAFIGHPLAGPKKVATWSGAQTGSFQGSVQPGWNANITAGGIVGGSSGSPLFNGERRVVGLVTNGNIGCSTGSRTVHAEKLSTNWEGSQPSKRLKDWLDPAGMGTLVLGGMDGGGNNTGPAGDVDLQVKVKLFLQGPFQADNGRMRADLPVPTTEPYTGLGYAHQLTGGGETTTSNVLMASGNARIVDWVVVELRQGSNPHTVVASRAGLLRRDGQVAEVDGSLNGLSFQGLSGTSFHVAVRHRNHLGVMSAGALDLAANNMVNLAAPGGTPLYGTEAATTEGSVRCLWMGDVDGNGIVKFTGSGNDRDLILEQLDGMINEISAGYLLEDTNLDGVVKYTGTDNDRDPLWNVLGGNAVRQRSAQLP